MHDRRGIRALFVTVAVVLLLTRVGTASAAEDGNGREWRQLSETTGLTWNQIAEICPRDGVTPCLGSVEGKVLTGWVWATDAQVIEFMGEYAPEILDADPPSVSGSEYFGPATGFLSVMRATFYVSGYGFYHESTAGWTSSVDGDGLPIEGRVGFGWWPPGGGFSVLPPSAGSEMDGYRGVWLWRTAGLDYSPPVITPSISGKDGSNGWYVSDVSVAWDIVDAESPIDSTAGCEPASIRSDTSGRSLSCSAKSAGGSATANVSVRRDATAPVLTCESPTPELELGRLGAKISASVVDATSGPAAATASSTVNALAPGSFSTPVTGTDRAGNKATKNCPYEVVIPPCLDLSPTLIGSIGNDVVTGTTGRDVILSLGGNDIIYGNGGRDVICSGGGSDTVRAGGGNDLVDGGSGDDALFGSTGDDTLYGGENNDSIRGEGGRDTCASGEARMSSCEVVL